LAQNAGSSLPRVLRGGIAVTIEFLITSLIVIVSPGTGVLYTLAAGLSRGARASVVAAFGCTLGIVPHMAAAIVGAAALLHTSALLFETFKWLGVAYLLYMAWSALRERGALKIDKASDPLVPASAGTQGGAEHKRSILESAGTNGESVRARKNLRGDLKVTVEGILITILNPKLSIFFFAFLPQFVTGNEPHPLGHMLMLSAVFMALTFAVFVGYGLFAAAIREHIISRPRVLTWMRRSFAAAFVALGVKLALQER
jgi:threonine/homoserine/homoserine lactone efflux protein